MQQHGSISKKLKMLLEEARNQLADSIYGKLWGRHD